MLAVYTRGLTKSLSDTDKGDQRELATVLSFINELAELANATVVDQTGDRQSRRSSAWLHLSGPILRAANKIGLCVTVSGDPQGRNALALSGVTFRWDVLVATEPPRYLRLPGIIRQKWMGSKYPPPRSVYARRQHARFRIQI